MYNLIWTNFFKKKIIKFLNKNPNIIVQFKNAIKTLEENPYHSSLKTHSLEGRLRDKYAISLT